MPCTLTTAHRPPHTLTPHARTHARSHAQNYNPSKRLEHGLKSLVHDPYAISVTHPRTYAQRFQSFLRSVFT